MTETLGPTPATAPEPRAADPAPFHVIGVGASAGGLEALERFFEGMPADTGMAFVVVQHLSPDFKSLMDELLARWTKLPIHRARHEMKVEPGRIYLMPPKTEMIISGGALLLTDKDPAGGLTMPIDQFFRSLARDQGPRAVGVILSGTGSDGSRGIRAIHDAGGLVVVQSEQTAKFDGMPRSALETGVADLTLAPEEMAPALLRHVRPPAPPGGAGAAGEPPPAAPAADGEMEAILQLLRDGYAIDFAYYKPSTVLRRTERRLQLNNAADLADYCARVRADRGELDALYHDLLIGVTRFFRDEAAFEILERDVLPDLFRRVPEGGEFRAWVAGCATGEEAYSLAILLHEALGRTGRRLPVKVFATDVHRASLDYASAGAYPDQALAGVSEARLRRYFTRTGGRYQVVPDLRQMIVFAPHNIIKDAPFTKMDLITCRNLLIYLQPIAQKKVLWLFHFALKAGAVLFLGPSETPGEVATEFAALDQHWKIYRKRRDVRLPADMRLPLSSGAAGPRPPAPPVPAHKAPDPQLVETFAALLDSSLPPSLLVRDGREVVHTFGEAAQYLRVRRGRPSLDLLEMLEGDLKLAVAGALHRALRTREPVSLTGVRAAVAPAAGGGPGPEVRLLVTVTPLPDHRSRANPYTLVSFRNVDLPERDHTPTDFDLARASSDRVDVLEAELRYTKENLQATIQELETSNEELQAANEELLAANEELQTTNEELHSVNEELYTVNAEYQKKITELTELTHDMDNLLLSTDVHTIFLDQNLCIRKFTPKMAEVFHLIPHDIGRRIDGFVHNIVCDRLTDHLAGVLAGGPPHEEEVQDTRGDVFFMRILPYRSDGGTAGVVMTLINITPLKQAEAWFRNAVEAAPSSMIMIHPGGRIVLVNSLTEEMFGYPRDELLGQPVEVLIPERFREAHPEHRREFFRNPQLRPMGTALELYGRRKDGSEFPVDVRLNPIRMRDGVFAMAAAVDVTERKMLERSLREQVRQRDRFLAMLSHELRNPLSAVINASSLLCRFTDQLPGLERPCGVIHRQAAQMATLLDDLLDVSRVTQGKIHLHPEVCDLTGLVREAMDTLEPMARNRRHRLRLDAPDHPIPVEADPSRLIQVTDNLLINAIKYTPDGGDIQVTTAKDGAGAVLRVRDNGRGIPAEQLEHIFKMFVQCDDTLDRSAGGMGLGLTLVRTLVELHGGTVSAASAGPGRGSEFVVRLPLTYKASAAPAAPPPGDAPPQTVRLVLVEDMADSREMLQALLALEGYRVEAAADGPAGLELIRRTRPDAALIDIGLPGMDGYQVARHVRDDFAREQILLVALTGYGFEEDRAAVLEAGFNEHLVKPVQLAELKRVLAAAARPAGQAGGSADPPA